MTSPTLIIMAAGIGSRYGGLKQVDPIGPNGEIVIDYSIYDAVQAGFGKIVFLIRREIEDIFREKIGSVIPQQVEIAYVYQDLAAVPAGFNVPPERKKPWGTGHAVWCCRDAVQTPFAAINADDFYGRKAFQLLSGYLSHLENWGAPRAPYPYAMAGYVLGNTLSEHGSVARGVCQVSPDGYLQTIQERTRIEAFGSQVKYTENGAEWFDLPAGSTVSMNMWGFIPSLFDELGSHFQAFLTKNAADLSKVEFYLPNVVNELLEENKARVKVLPTDEKWFGVTHPDDRGAVQAALRRLIEQGYYPPKLWV